MGRQFVIEADNPDHLPFAWHDLVCIHDMVQRADLNGLLAEAHGRIKKGTQYREGVTVLSTGEQVWARRSKLQLLRTPAQLQAAVEDHAIDAAERDRGRQLLGDQILINQAIHEEWQQKKAADEV